MNDYEQIIKENAQEYYTTGKQKLSDEAFDALVDEVQSSNPSSDVLKTGWGYEVNSNGKIKHKYGLVGSLSKIRTLEEVEKFMGSPFFEKQDVSAKIDGISAVLYYKNGELDLALTRGDGEYGIDITEKVRKIITIDVISLGFTGAIRGELTMPVAEYKLYKEKHPESKNSRNSVAGLINGDKITEDYKYIRFVPYSIVGYEGLDSFSLKSANQFLEDNFSNFAPRVCINYNGIAYENKLKELKNIWEQKYFIDGLVLTKDIKQDTNTKEVIYDQVAYKFEAETKVTEILDIEWNMSKNSAYIPVAIIKPVELAGTTVKRATLYNAKYVKDNKLGTGAIVTVCKRGEIIPKVMEVIKEAEFADLPTHCGYCNEPLVWDSVDLVCDNINCKQKENEDIKAVCTNLAPVEGLGWKTINKFLSNINNIEDLLNISKFYDVENPNSEKGLFNIMLDKLQYGKFTISQFLLSLNIPGLGKIGVKAWEDSKNAIKYIQNIINGNNDDNFFDNIALAKLLQNYKLVDELYNYSNKFKLYWDLFGSRILVNMPINENKENYKQQGSVCITGRLSMKRDDFIDMIKQYGWSFDSTIKATTTYLITDTPNSNTSKNKKADELGVKKITESEFVNNIMRGE